MRVHMFDRVCEAVDIEHRASKLSHPWTNDQVECMNRTIKEATAIRAASSRGSIPSVESFRNTYGELCKTKRAGALVAGRLQQ